MNIVTVAAAAGRGAAGGLGWRIGRAARDGCIALAVLQTHGLIIVDRLPAAAMSHIAILLGGDATGPGAEEMLRVAAFGSFSLEAMANAAWLAVLSLILRLVLTAGLAAWDAARTPREAAHG